MTLLPCASPYSFELQVFSVELGGELVNGVYSESTDVPFVLVGFDGRVSITVVQQSYGVTVSVSGCISCVWISHLHACVLSKCSVL